MASNDSGLLDVIASHQDVGHYQELLWEGSFVEYLSLVQKDPQVIRNAYQRLFDLVDSHGFTEYTEYKKTIRRYNFFDDPYDLTDGVFGVDVHLMKLVRILHAAALGYGPEKRVILLHGPVGSAKSTIARLLKKGLEAYSRTPEGALYTYAWKTEGGEIPCPMHEDPIRLLPNAVRPAILDKINSNPKTRYKAAIEGDLCPVCRHMWRDAMRECHGDFVKMQERIVVRRMVLSEKDRVGIGTFQPKDEKNQDSTELTGDINYRLIAEFGSDSDPRAFNFDGEFNVANRGLIEFIEVLKLDVAFLYDLLGASQEHRVKPKKFAQTHIDEVILGHSVAGETPIPFRYHGTPGWTTLEDLYDRFQGATLGLEVLAWDFSDGQSRWTPVRKLFRHRFGGDMLTTSQKWGVVETTPNHSIYGRDGETFFPEERHEILAVREIQEGFAARTGVLDALQCISGLVGHEVREVVGGGRMTRPAQSGWRRLALPRHATQVRALYDINEDVDALKDLITVLVWYATEGHVNGRNGGIVITQNDRDELERVRRAYANVTTGKGSIDAGAKTDDAWRLYLGSMAIAEVATALCSEYSENKRLPDWLFELPREYLEHAFDELMRTDGTRTLSTELERTASESYRANFFEYKTLSPVLAAQVGTLATLLDLDYSVYRYVDPGADKAPAYRIRYVSGDNKRGGRHKRFEARLESRATWAEWVYDIECEGLHNFVCGVGNVVCHNTNEPEFRRLQNNEYMEALRDRTIKVDVPYITKPSQEARIYAKDFNSRKVAAHIAPHTIEMAALWAVLTRLEAPTNHKLTLVQKARLYDGRNVPGFTEDHVKELRKTARREGLEGISPRYVQDKISNALVRDPDVPCLNPFMVLNELESGLDHHSLLSNDEQRERYRELLGVVKVEYEDRIKNEVQKAIAADEGALKRMSGNYIDNLRAYVLKEKVKNPFTGQAEEPNERLMRSIEEKIDIPDGRKDDFRRELMNYIAGLALDGKTFDYSMNERLHRALELKLFEDSKDSIKLTSLISQSMDPDTQEKIDIVRSRMIDHYGYCEVCARDVLQYVASIFARGDATPNDEEG